MSDLSLKLLRNLNPFGAWPDPPVDDLHDVVEASAREPHADVVLHAAHAPQTEDPTDPIAVLVAIAEHHLGYTLPPERIAWDGPALPPEMTAVTLTPEEALNVRSDTVAGGASLAERLIRLAYQFGYAAGEWPERNRGAAAVSPRTAPANVAAFVLRTPKHDRLLLVRSGKAGRAWELPGGAVEPGEEQFDAVLREVKEETGAVFHPDSSDPFAVVVNVEGCAVFRGYAWAPLTAGGDALEAHWFERADIAVLNLSDLPTAALIREWAGRP